MVIFCGKKGSSEKLSTVNVNNSEASIRGAEKVRK